MPLPGHVTTLTPAEEGFGKQEKGALTSCIQKHRIAPDIQKNGLKYVPHFIIKKQLWRFLGSASQATYCELMQLNITSAFLGRRGMGEWDKGVWVEVSQVQLNSGNLLLTRGTSQRSCGLSGQTAGEIGRMSRVPQNPPPLLCPLECSAECLSG